MLQKQYLSKLGMHGYLLTFFKGLTRIPTHFFYGAHTDTYSLFLRGSHGYPLTFFIRLTWIPTHCFYRAHTDTHSLFYRAHFIIGLTKAPVTSYGHSTSLSFCLHAVVNSLFFLRHCKPAIHNFHTKKE